jgi:small GTP-binding protein
MLIDTGGIEPYSDDIILKQMRRQAQLAIDSANVIILVTDLRSGVVATDSEVASMLQKSGKPVILCVNKCDNVGKSTLFNKLCGKRLSIVDDTPGVTRDRIYGECEWLNRNMILVDTGGIEPYSDDIILSQMRRQAQLAIDSADVIVLVCDVRTGVVAADQEVAADVDMDVDFSMDVDELDDFDMDLGDDLGSVDLDSSDPMDEE